MLRCFKLNMSENSVQILPSQKLKGRENYHEWKFQLQNILKLDNLWTAVVGYEVDDKTTEDVRKRRDEKALAKINLSVDRCVFPLVIKAKNAKEAWDALSKAYDDKSLYSRLKLLRRLCNINLINFKSMEEYVNEILNLSQQLSAMNKPLDDEFLAAVMLSGLTEEYDPMVMALENSTYTITSDLIKQKLLQDDKYKEQKSLDSALFTSNNMKKKPWCSFCKKSSHWKSECRKLAAKSTNFKQMGETSKEKSSKNQSGSQVTRNKALRATNSPLQPSPWCIDSGASSHMTGDENLLINFSNKHNGSNIYVANNNELRCGGTGDTIVKLSHNNQTKTISDIMYVENLTANLLSVSAIVQKDYSVIFDKQGCRIVDIETCPVQGEVVATANNVGGLYIIYSVNHPK